MIAVFTNWPSTEVETKGTISLGQKCLSAIVTATPQAPTSPSVYDSTTIDWTLTPFATSPLGCRVDYFCGGV